MPRVSFAVPFVRGKGRPRFDPRTRRAYTDRETVAAERAVWAAYGAACGGEPLQAPPGVGVAVAIACSKPLAKSVPRRVESMPYTAKPDADNVVKLVLDGLNPHGQRPGAWADDSQVTQVTISKLRRTRWCREETTVKIEWEETTDED